MAHTYEDQDVARHEWLSADANYKVAAIIIAECIRKFGSVSDERIEEYKVARQAEVNAWRRYMEITHAGEEVEA